MPLFWGQMTQKNLYIATIKSIGAEDLVKEPINGDYDLIPLIKRGLFKKNLVKLAERMSMSIKDIAAILPVSERTLKRYRSTTRLSPELSERLLKLSELYSKGIDVFGSKEKFIKWMNLESLAIGSKPINIIDTLTGIQLVKDELGRIEYGVYI
jgi:putative toxin-antitoxin system antitoxin component (TIGR02293 family)